jgi:hypothetical protein
VSRFAEVDGYFITVMRAFGGRSSEVDPCEKNWLTEGGEWITLGNGGPSLGWANGADSYEHC